MRTTILVRRHERRQRAEDVKAAAVFGVKKAGLKGAGVAANALNSAQAGSLAALKWSGDRLSKGARKSAAGIAYAAARGASGARAGMAQGRVAMAPKIQAAGLAARRGAERAAEKLEPVRAPLREPGLQLALKLIAGVATAGALIRAYQFGFDGHALTAIIVASAAVCLLLFSGLHGGWGGRIGDASRATIERFPALGFLGRRSGLLTALAVLVVAVAVAGGAIALWHRGAPAWPRFAGSSIFSSQRNEQSPANSTLASRDPSEISGSGSAQSGDSLKVAGSVVKLEGIESPVRSQTCSKSGGKRWDCAASAREALARLVHGRRVTCKVSALDGEAPRSGRCTAGDIDVGSELVRRGHVFAAAGLFALYKAQESEAQAAKTGLWAGEAQRPAEWRAARWEEAKRQAPDGCPIKGQVFRRSGKVYMLPWSPEYERARVNAAEGERWFCSESEAVSAGWKPL